MAEKDLDKAALRGEPSYVWRAGQERRLQMILEAAGERVHGSVLENGCGVGVYVKHLAQHAGVVVGLEYDFERARGARQIADHILSAAGEALPFSDGTFDLMLSHEVLEHVQDDRRCVQEMLRSLKPAAGWWSSSRTWVTLSKRTGSTGAGTTASCFCAPAPVRSARGQS